MAGIRPDTKIGEKFTGKPKLVSWERLWTFSGGPFRRVLNKEDGGVKGDWPVKNIHTDLPFAKSCGLPKVAASATQYEGYMVQLMVDLFGIDWFSNGRMDVKFPNLVDVDDVLTASAVVKDKKQVGKSTRFLFDIGCENQRGDKVVVGWASGVIGGAPAKKTDEYDARIAELRADSSLQKREGMRGLTPLEFFVTPELNQQYCYSEEDFNPRYLEATEPNPAIAHPGLVLNWSNATRSPGYVRGGPGKEGGVHTQDEVFWYNPAYVGKKLYVSWPSGFAASYERRGRTYSMGEILVVDEDGREIVRRLSRNTMAATPEKPYRKSGSN